MDSDRGRRMRRLPRPWGGDYPKRGYAAYEPVDPDQPDRFRTVDVPRIGSYPLLVQWAALHGLSLRGADGVEVLDRAITNREIQIDGPIMAEVAYYVGDLLCEEQSSWRWNVDAWGLPVLVLDREDLKSPEVWDILGFLRRRSDQGSPTLAEALAHFRGGTDH
ncbi:hypothetical protein [Sinomonas atrocyanea]|nr:hypothetical protein [Sinomonas atrocyanea]